MWRKIWYKSGELTCIKDVLEATGDGFTLTEIKSSNSAKPENVTDLAFHRLVVEASGYDIQKCQVMHANPDYERADDIDPNVLTKITDVTDQVEKILSKTKENAASAVRVMNLDNIPDVDPLLAAPSAFEDCLIRDLLKNLSKQINSQGRMLVWNQSFEKKRNEEMARYSPEHANF